MSVRSIKNQKGQSLVEFAMILPFLLLLIMGIVQFGMLLNSYLGLQNAAREGARTGIVGSTNTEIQNSIIATSPTLDVNNLTINITPSEAIRESGEALTVKVSYNFQLTIPIISNIFGNEIILNAQTSMRIE